MLFEKKMPFEMDDEERELFSVAVKTDDHSGSEVDVAHDIFIGLLELWVLKNGDSRVLVISKRVVNRDNSVEAFINMMSGTNIVNLQAEIFEAFGKEMSKQGCQTISALVAFDLAKKLKFFDKGEYLNDKIKYVAIELEV